MSASEGQPGVQRSNSKTVLRTPSIRRGSRCDDSVAPSQPVDWAAASTYLEAELAAARSAVAALDGLYPRVCSFKEVSLTLLEEAHRALVRLEQASTRAKEFPELVVLACEIKLNAKRGEHLMRVYGSYKYLGKLLAMALRSKVSAKFSRVVERLKQLPGQLGASSLHPGGASTPALNGSSTPVSPGYSRQVSQVDRADGDHGSQHSLHMSSSGAAMTALEQGLGLLGLHKGYHVAAKHARPRGLVLRQFVRSQGHDKVHCITQVPLPPVLDTASSIHSRTSSCGGGSGALGSAWALNTGSAAAAAGGSSAANLTLWWSVGQALEFYSGATQCIASFPMDSARKCVTVVRVDRAGSVWCGTAKGVLLVRRRHCWDQVFEATLFASPVRCIEFDAESDVAWVGDDGGWLKVVRCDCDAGVLEVTAMLLKGRGHLKGGGSIANLAPRLTKSFKRLNTLTRTRSTPVTEAGLHVEPLHTEGPITAAVVRDDRAWVAGGRNTPWIMLFDAVSGAQLSSWDCNHVGVVHAMAVLHAPGAAASRRISRLDSMRAPTAASGLVGGTPWGPAPLSVPAMVPEDGNMEPRTCWRLLTGHDHGQVLMWSASSDVLQPLARLGDPGGSPIRALGVHDDQGLISQVHASGELVVYLRPSEDVEWAAASLNNGQISTLRPRKVVIEAHRSGTSAACASSSAVVTASLMGTIKLWSAEALAAEAAGVGLVLAHARSRSISMASETGLRPHSPAAHARSVDPPSSPNSMTAAAAAGSLGGNGSSNPSTPTGRHLRFSETPVGPHMPGMSGVSGQRVPHPQQEGAAAVTPTSAGVAPAAVGGGSYSSHHGQQQQQQQQQQLEPEHKPQQGQEWPTTNGAPSAGGSSARGRRTSRSTLTEALQGGEGLPAQQQQQQQQADGMRPRKTDSSNALNKLDNSSRMSSFSTPLPAYGSEAALAAAAAAAVAVGSPSNWQLGSSGSPAQGQAVGSAFAAASAAAGGSGAASQSGSRCPTPRAQSLTSPMPGTPVSVSERGVVAGSVAGVPDGAPVSDSQPRKPRHMRLAEEETEERTRRKSERRLSRGAQIAWSTCQIIESQELRLLSAIGSGAYGKVWKADWAGTEVAVKELLSIREHAHGRAAQRHQERRAQEAATPDPEGEEESDDSDTDSVDSVEEEVNQELKTLMDEVYLLGSMSHPNIMRFCAVCLDPPMIVTQYYPHGSLFDLLKRGRRGDKRALQELSWGKRLDMLRDVSAGMVFLHSRRPPVIHGDLRSPNLLLDLTFDGTRPRFHIRIADFGLARMLGADSSIAVSKVTNPRWSAPEVIRSSAVSRSADVFSYGVVMWEMLTWEQPYEDMMSIQVLFSVTQNTRPELPPDDDLPGRPCPEALSSYKDLMTRCWDQEPAARPSFEAIVAALDDMRAKEAMRRAEAGSRCSTPVSRIMVPQGSSTSVQNSPTYSQYSHASSFPGEEGLLMGLPGHHAHSSSTLGGGTPYQSGGGRSSHPGGSPGRLGDVYTPGGACIPGGGAGLGAMEQGPSAFSSAGSSTAAGLGVSLGHQALPPGVIGPYGLPSIRTVTQSDPGGHVASPLGDRRLQLAGVGSSPTHPGAPMPAGAGSMSQAGSGPVSPMVGCELSFAAGSAFAASGSNFDHARQGSLSPPQAVAAAGGAPGGGAAAHLLPNAALGLFAAHPPVTRTPSRLGPSRTNSNIGVGLVSGLGLAYGGHGSGGLPVGVPAATAATGSTGNSPRLLTSSSYGGALPVGIMPFNGPPGSSDNRGGPSSGGYGVSAGGAAPGSWDSRYGANLLGPGGMTLVRQHSGAPAIGFSHLSRTLSSPRATVSSAGVAAVPPAALASPAASPGVSPRYSAGALINPFSAIQQQQQQQQQQQYLSSHGAVSGTGRWDSSAPAESAPGGFAYPHAQEQQQQQEEQQQQQEEEQQQQQRLGAAVQHVNARPAAFSSGGAATTAATSTTPSSSSPFAAAQQEVQRQQQVDSDGGMEGRTSADAGGVHSGARTSSSSSGGGPVVTGGPRPPSSTNLPASPFALAQPAPEQPSVTAMDQQLTVGDQAGLCAAHGSGGSGGAKSRPASPFAEVQQGDMDMAMAGPVVCSDSASPLSSPPASGPTSSRSAAGGSSSGPSSGGSRGAGRRSRTGTRPSPATSPIPRSSFESTPSPFAAIQAVAEDSRSSSGGMNPPGTRHSQQQQPTWSEPPAPPAATVADGAVLATLTAAAAAMVDGQRGPDGSRCVTQVTRSPSDEASGTRAAYRPRSPFSAVSVQGLAAVADVAPVTSSGAALSDSMAAAAPGAGGGSGRWYTQRGPSPVAQVPGTVTSVTSSSPPHRSSMPTSPFAAASSQQDLSSSLLVGSSGDSLGGATPQQLQQQQQQQLRSRSPFAASAGLQEAGDETFPPSQRAGQPQALLRMDKPGSRPATPMSTYASAESQMSITADAGGAGAAHCAMPFWSSTPTQVQGNAAAAAAAAAVPGQQPQHLAPDVWQQQQQGAGSVVHVDSEDADTPKWHPPGVSGAGGAFGDPATADGSPDRPLLGQLPSLASFTPHNPWGGGTSSAVASPDRAPGQPRQQQHWAPEQRLPGADSVTFPRVRAPLSRKS